MANTKHTATLDGQTFTRTSKTRVYTHCVVVKPCMQRALAGANSSGRRLCDADNWAYHTKVVAAGGNVHMTRWSEEPSDSFIERCEANADRNAEQLAGRDCATYVSDQLQARLDVISKQEAEGYYGRWQQIGWSSRFDLAHRQAQAAGKLYARTAAIPARTS